MLINQRYRLLDKLGTGGMGEVYAASDRLTGHPIALKRLTRSSSLPDDTQRLAMAVEFRVLAALHHPNIVSVLDYGFETDGTPFFTMELIPEPRTLIEAGDDAARREQVRLMVEMLEALAYLHRRGLIHRDLKPGNVLVDRSGRVRVLDFGLATEILSQPHTDTEVVGTLAYMAPEVLRGDGPSAASDLYAAGIMAYEIFSGRYPFAQSDITVMLASIYNAQPDLTRLDDELRPVIGRLLMREAAERYQSAEEVISALCEATEIALPPQSAEIRESYLQASAFVGRDDEMRRLDAALDETLAGGAAAWLVGGESGVGKSRLLDELRIRALVRGALVLRGHGVAGGGLAYQLWRDPLRRLAISTPMDDLQAGIIKALVPDLDALLERPIATAPELEREGVAMRLAQTTGDLLRRQTQPVLLLLEDLHWTNESLEILKALFPPRPGLMIVGTYRDDETPDLPHMLPEMQVMKLVRLNPQAIADLSAAMLGAAGSRPAVVDLLQRETEGNAYFMVEVVRVLAEDAGTLSAVGQATLPSSVMAGGIQQVLERRLGRVPDWAQPALKFAALAGREIDTRLLQTQLQDLERWLRVCANAAVLEVAEGTWRFSHDKLREAARDLIAADERPALHRSVAEAILSTYPGDESYAEALADHFYHAGHMAQAVHFTVTAAQRLVFFAADYRRAQQLIERALPHALPEDEARLLRLLGQSLDYRGMRPESIALYQRALALDGITTRTRIAVLIALCGACNGLRDHESVGRYAELARSLAQSIGYTYGEGLALHQLATSAYHQGDYEAARDSWVHGFALLRDEPDPRIHGIIIGNLGTVHYMLSEYEMARTYYYQHVAIAREIGERRGVGTSLLNAATLEHAIGNYDEARRLLHESLDILRSVGDMEHLAHVTVNLGLTLFSLGDYAAAEQRHKEGLRIFTQLENTWGIGYSLCHLGLTALVQDDYATARACFVQSLHINREIEDAMFVALNLSNLVLLAQVQGDAIPGEFDEFRQTARSAGDPELLAESLLVYIPLSLRTLGPEQTRKDFVEGLALVRERQTLMPLVDAVVGAALWAEAAGDPHTAAAYATYALQHPKIDHRMLPLLRQIAARLRTGLTQADFAAAASRFDGYDLSALVDEIAASMDA